ncbi:type II toxin-antitoxin system RelE/ParE family toxin [Pseudofrankia saprophytica]|uniref:type II toxin-antitoxin system RelE/ParE family toxin n=1 Tax=Pseudofrankia saprophytica TaxID=298655 RepID=UPI000234DABE|nr:type II toxin-antitoxin system RelE/ParE family toxin [Pseudofrankia saprophytica]
MREWLERLPTGQFAAVAFYVDVLASRGPLLGEPYSRQLDGKLREPRFYLDGRAVRVTYWLAPGQQAVLLTVLTKTQMRERGQVDRAKRTLARCLAERHTADEDDRREGGEGRG